MDHVLCPIFKVILSIFFKTWNNEITLKHKKKKKKNVSHLEIAKVVLVHSNIVNNDYQQDSRVLYTFVSNKPFGSLLEISPRNYIFLKTFNSEFQALEVWFTN